MWNELNFPQKLAAVPTVRLSRILIATQLISLTHLLKTEEKEDLSREELNERKRKIMTRTDSQDKLNTITKRKTSWIFYLLIFYRIIEAVNYHRR